MRSLIWLMVSAGALGFAPVACNAQPKDAIKLERIKAADVEKAVAAHKGKVVVVDVWGEF